MAYFRIRLVLQSKFRQLSGSENCTTNLILSTILTVKQRVSPLYRTMGGTMVLRYEHVNIRINFAFMLRSLRITYSHAPDGCCPGT